LEAVKSCQERKILYSILKLSQILTHISHSLIYVAEQKSVWVKVGTKADWYYEESKSRCCEVPVREVFLSVLLFDAGGVFG